MPRPQRKLKPPSTPKAGVDLDLILSRLEENGREVDEPWMRKVYSYSEEMHRGQRRKSGDDYLSHPLAVAYILADLKFDPTCVAVALLHDVLEDTDATFPDLEKGFGREVAELVDGVSKIGQHEYVQKDQAQAETFRKLILASARDIRVILVKIADRLHNMQTLEHMKAEQQERIALETLEIFAPLAHRLGMSRVRAELEDLSFFFLHPGEYREIQSQLRERMKVGRGLTERIRDRLESELGDAGIDADISFRVKHLYSISRKLRERGLDFDQLYDYLAFRIVTSEIKDTYGALGVVHQAWKPLPGRFKDYIAVPKPNLYQSLHTSVVNREGQPFEVQIRTREMDQVAEEGIAAHWSYKEGTVSAASSDSNVLWLRRLLEWQRGVRDPRTFLNDLKIDLYPDEVYVFTPKGDVHGFPRDATPLDFAYRVHTDLGHHCTGARVNGKLVPLRTMLNNGDIVEIQISASRTPSRDWLNIVKTSRARTKIRHWLNSQQKTEAIEIGRRLLDQEARKFRISPRRVLQASGLKDLLETEGHGNVDDLYARIGFGRTPARQVLERVLGKEELTKSPAPEGRLRKAVRKILPFEGAAVRIRGEGDLLATIARCCHPVPGEPIVGFVTRGRGVSVHSEDCTNVKNLLYHPEREIEVEWSTESEQVYPVTLQIEADDRPGVLAKLTELIAKRGSNIRTIDARRGDGSGASIEVVVEIKDQRQLTRLQDGILKLPEVVSVTRRRAHRQMSPAAGESPDVSRH
jgi:GTP pyrophosphokinase